MHTDDVAGVMRPAENDTRGDGAGPAPASPRLWLRAATARRHQQVDQGFARYDLATRPGYGALLAVHAAALLPLEAALARAGIADLLPDWPERRRTAALLADLVDLGVSPGAPVAVTLDPDPAALFGTAYVLEGSRMGAAYLLKAVLANPHAAGRTAMRYLDHGRGRPLWPRFVAQLDVSAAVQARPDRALAAADAAFGTFLDALAAGPAPRPD